MRRRAFLAGGCLGTATVLAGCPTAGVPGLGEPRHPFAGRTVAVRVTNQSDTDHDVEANARESMAFWADNAPVYAGFEVDFELVRSGDDPNLTVAYVDSPDPHCRGVEGFSERVLGCAPVLAPDKRVPEDLTAWVVAAARPYGKIRTTTKHEIGHVLGLYHDDEPRGIMSNRPEDRIPMYATRIEIWETVLAASERSGDGSRLHGLGVTSWRDADYEAAEPAFAAAADEFAAARGLVDTATERTAEFEGHDLDETLALADLRGHLAKLRSRAVAAEGYAAGMAGASTAAAAGDNELANERVAEANRHVREYNDIDPVELRDVAIALGLVRGFDREEKVVELDEDEELD